MSSVFFRLDSGFKIQWEDFIRPVVEDAPWRFTLAEGAKGVRLVEAALQSWRERHEHIAGHAWH